MASFQKVKGTMDVYGHYATVKEKIVSILSEMAELYHYSPIETPMMESTALFERSTGGTTDVVEKQMYTFFDKGGRSLTLRPEYTAGVARAIVENKLYASEDLPLKLYYHGPLFRYERPGLGRYREFNQFGVECVGESTPWLDAETLLLAVESLYYLGFRKVKAKINSLGGKASREAYKKALVAYFEPHVGEMCEDCQRRIKTNPLRLLDCKVEHDKELAKGAPSILDYLVDEDRERFKQIVAYLQDLGVDFEVDPGLVRGLDYYSGLVFEIALSGAKDYGSVLGGGHYDDLLGEIGGPSLPGVGFAVGLERLIASYMDEGLDKGSETRLDVYLMPIGEEAYRASVPLLVETRLNGYSAELAPKPAKLGAYFKRAERAKARFALIYGDEELKKGKANLKDLDKVEQVEIDLSNLAEELDAHVGRKEESEGGEHRHD